MEDRMSVATRSLLLVVAALTGLVLVGAPAKAAGSGNALNPDQVLFPGESITSGSGKYRFTMQTDGNAVVYNGSGTPLWHSYSYGYRGAAFAMQGDGNAVMYHNGRAVKATGTAGRNGARLVIQDDGNLVLYATNGNPLWNSGTYGG